ncbi:hypothetical protein [Demequina rhizosphaerae]|uniref:hypothetical protein n=1 Tax=Demequina rhizosphaerae TaxID=1638985 RepID=UPI0007827980|nr:hypothetical protein [Demequina rhizosphaerae]
MRLALPVVLAVPLALGLSACAQPAAEDPLAAGSLAAGLAAGDVAVVGVPDDWEVRDDTSGSLLYSATTAAGSGATLAVEAFASGEESFADAETMAHEVLESMLDGADLPADAIAPEPFTDGELSGWHLLLPGQAEPFRRPIEMYFLEDGDVVLQAFARGTGTAPDAEAPVLDPDASEALREIAEALTVG